MAGVNVDAQEPVKGRWHLVKVQKQRLGAHWHRSLRRGRGKLNPYRCCLSHVVGKPLILFDGVFKVCEQGLKYYIDTYNPKILRDSRKTDTKNLPALNFGLSKGQTFERVLIFPNGPIKANLKDRDASRLKDKTKAIFYVGLTRAMHSVVFFR
jgi:hypothetical protein